VEDLAEVGAAVVAMARPGAAGGIEEFTITKSRMPVTTPLGRWS
jgi:hypothetical protein